MNSVNVDLKTISRKYTDISCGMGHILLVDNEGNAYGRGANQRGQLGAGGKTKSDNIGIQIYETYGNSILNMKQFYFPEKIKNVCAGKYLSVFLSGIFSKITDIFKENGNVYMIKGLKTKFIAGEFSDSINKLDFPNDEKIIQIACGDHHALFLSGIFHIILYA